MNNISIIASVGKNHELGKDNKLIWHIPRDMKYFKETTMGHTVVMGRKTYESLPGNLPGRKMIVLTSKNIDDNKNIEVVSSIDELLERYLNTDEELFIIGGAMIYRAFIDYASMLYLTEIDALCPDADTYFPNFNKDEWDRTVIEKNNYKTINYEICKYKRRVIK